MDAEKGAEDIRVETFQVGSSTFTLAPEAGFRLMGWTLKSGHGTREILYWPEDWREEALAKVRGGNPILFPFAGRSFVKGREDTWRTPEGARLPMPRHGFARDGRFVVEELLPDAVTGRLEPSDAARESYPFAYAFRVSYQFGELALKATLSLDNRDERPIPWSAGHHFYFTLPWHPGARRSDYHLHLESRKRAYHGPDGKLVMVKDRENCHDFSNTELVDRIHWQLRHNRVSFGPKSGEEDIHIVVGDTPVPLPGTAVVTWTGSEDAPYYCVEPWMGPPNAAEHGKGLHWVNPGETGAFTVEVSLY